MSGVLRTNGLVLSHLPRPLGVATLLVLGVVDVGAQIDVVHVVRDSRAGELTEVELAETLFDAVHAADRLATLPALSAATDIEREYRTGTFNYCGFGVTPLVLAAWHGHAQIVEDLVAFGALVGHGFPLFTPARTADLGGRGDCKVPMSEGHRRSFALLSDPLTVARSMERAIRAGTDGAVLSLLYDSQAQLGEQQLSPQQLAEWIRTSEQVRARRAYNFRANGQQVEWWTADDTATPRRNSATVVDGYIEQLRLSQTP